MLFRPSIDSRSASRAEERFEYPAGRCRALVPGRVTFDLQKFARIIDQYSEWRARAALAVTAVAGNNGGARPRKRHGQLPALTCRFQNSPLRFGAVWRRLPRRQRVVQARSAAAANVWILEAIQRPLMAPCATASTWDDNIVKNNTLSFAAD